MQAAAPQLASLVPYLEGKPIFKPWSHISSWMAGGFWFLAILFSFVQSGRGPGGDKEARGGGSRKQVAQWFGKPSPPFVLQALTGLPTAPPAQLFMLAGMTSSPARLEAGHASASPAQLCPEKLGRDGRGWRGPASAHRPEWVWEGPPPGMRRQLAS